MRLSYSLSWVYVPTRSVDDELEGQLIRVHDLIIEWRFPAFGPCFTRTVQEHNAVGYDLICVARLAVGALPGAATETTLHVRLAPLARYWLHCSASWRQADTRNH